MDYIVTDHHNSTHNIGPVLDFKFYVSSGGSEEKHTVNKYSKLIHARNNKKAFHCFMSNTDFYTLTLQQQTDVKLIKCLLP